MEAVVEGLGLLADPFNIALILGGVVIGVLVGALPGLSSPMAIALLIPFTIQLEPVPAISMMAPRPPRWTAIPWPRMASRDGRWAWRRSPA